MVGLFVTDAWLTSPPLKPTRSRAPRRGSGAGAERKRAGGCARRPLLRPTQTAVGVPARARHKARAPLAAMLESALAAMLEGSLADPPKARWRARRLVGSPAQSPLAAAQQGARGPRPPRPPRSDTAPRSRAGRAKIAAGAPQARQPSTASRRAPRAQATRAPPKGAR